MKLGNTSVMDQYWRMIPHMSLIKNNFFCFLGVYNEMMVITSLYKLFNLQTKARNASVCIYKSQDGIVIRKLDNKRAGMTAVQSFVYNVKRIRELTHP